MISDKEYLELILESAKAALEELRIQRRVAIAEHTTKKDMLEKQINSIEIQLKGTKEAS